MTHIKDLTVIIPTYERETYARRAIEYWHRLGVVLHVFDGSRHPMNPGSLPLSDKIHYHHVRTSMVDRLNAAINVIDTPYCCLIGDDEFHLRSGLLACLDELEADPELVACLGRTMAFKYKDEQLSGMPWYLGMEGKEVMQGSPAARMACHMRDYLPSTIYAVTRTPVWQASMRAATAESFPVFAIGELQFEAATAYQGKSKVIPVLSWLRNTGVPAVKDGDASLITRTRFHDWWADPEQSVEKAHFLEIMAAHLIQGGDHAAVAQDVNAAFDIYVQCCEQRKQAYQAKRKAALEAAAAQKAAMAAAPAPGPTPPARSGLLGLVKRMTSALSGDNATDKEPPAPSAPPKYTEIFSAARAFAAQGVTVDMDDLRDAVASMETEIAPEGEVDPPSGATASG